jgi:hypothetical protein
MRQAQAIATPQLTWRCWQNFPRAQVGLAEMKPVVDMTGGMVVQTDTFLNPVFKESFKRVFAQPGTPGALEISSNATFEVGPDSASLVLCPL